MKPFSPRRKRTLLSDSLQQQLNSYAMAAGAAGVSLLALARPAEAKIIYTAVHENAVGVNLDLDNDGTPDFRICFSNNTYHCSSTSAGRRPPGYFDALVVKPLNALNKIRGKGFLALALAPGKEVKGIFPGSDYTMAVVDCSSTCYSEGHWFNATKRYLGFKFRIDGKNHYGWARLTVHWANQKATLTGYAYETVPGKSLITGQTKEANEMGASEADADRTSPVFKPASLGVLATGAQGLSRWRRKEPALLGK